MNTTETTTSPGAPPDSPGARRPASLTALDVLRFLRTVALPLVVSLTCLWLANSVLPVRAQAPNNALVVLGAFTILAAFYSRRTRQRLRALGAANATLPLTLPDLTGALYLAMLVLVGARAAIPFAIVTPFIAHAPDILRNRRMIAQALREGMYSSLTLLACGFAFATISRIVPHVPTSLRAHIFAALAASLIFLIGFSVTRLLQLAPAHSNDLRRAIRAYRAGPALLFQALLLTSIPLLPLTESLQPVEIEFTWLLLLAPMAAVYYLALTSVRVRVQSDKLQNTIVELNATRLRETQLQNYAALITRAQEDERRRLARDLHDDTAQALIALSRGLDALANRHINPVSSPEDVNFLDKLVDLTQRTLESVRRACQDLRPSVLDDLGLPAALESLAGAMTERGLPCSYQEQGSEQPYPPEVEVAVYRIAQEALSNALRHAEPKHARIELRYRPDGLRLVVWDDGKGFDVPAILGAAPGGASHSSGRKSGAGLGLMGMRERATLVGATLDIESAPGAGTRIILEEPASAPTTPLLPDAAGIAGG
ncbi:MAG TPA: sensor histidine kinase [Ktedonobacterales bacterium]